MTAPIRLAILGLGTVGTGVLTLLQNNLTEMTRRSNRNIQITYVGSRRERPELNLDGIERCADIMEIVTKDDVDIIIEVIGGTEIAKQAVITALQHGKHVVTANKALLAEHGEEIFTLAEQNDVYVGYEAAVAGGIPIIKVIREALAANQISWLAGIINGTSNYISTQMSQHGESFDSALADAQRLGYAEADPTFDIEGVDAAHKLTLLASIAFGIPLQFDKIYCEGMTQITDIDVTYADELGYVIKHLGFAIKREDGIELRVHPTLIPKDKLLANVNDVKNAVLIESDPLGQTLYYGAGAGAGATASAVMADVMDLVRILDHRNSSASNHVYHLGYAPDNIDDTRILTIAQTYSRHYLRISVDDHPGVLAEITGILSKANINIDAIIQKPANQKGCVPVILLTQFVYQENLDRAIGNIEALQSVQGDIVDIRLSNLD